jgi:hypothetical protein
MLWLQAISVDSLDVGGRKAAVLDRRCCIAPMMDWSDSRSFR